MYSLDHLHGIRQQSLSFLGSQPRICVLNQFLTEVECEHLIKISTDSLAPSTSVDNDTGEVKLIESRSSWNTYFYTGHDEVISGIEHRIYLLTGIPVENGEGIQILRYEVGQQYKSHYDYFNENATAHTAHGGQRIATVLMYLGEPVSGGETEFPLAGVKVKPIRGNALLFWNTFPEGQVDPTTLHSSLPVTEGVKWTATKWLRQHPYR